MVLPLSIFSVSLEPENLLVLISVLVIFALMMSKIGVRFGAPVLLVFLILGMLVGADGLGVQFAEYESAERLGHFAMSIILFAGGLETSLQETRPVMRQGILLSTLGVLVTVLLTGGFIALALRPLIGGVAASVLGCFMLAAIMSSTDSTSVFSVLRGQRLKLRENLAPLLELESGSNDPLALSLTAILVGILSKRDLLFASDSTLTLVGASLLALLLQIGTGLGMGFAIGYGARWLLGKVKLSSPSLTAIMVLGIGLFANGLASMLGGNGLLALYVTAILIGNKAPLGGEKKDILKFFDAMSWLMQLLMFLMLGLLARPSQMPQVLLPALLIGLFMMLVARPASVFLCLLPFPGLSVRAKTLISWVGLKGAGPILFALSPVVAGLEGSAEIFNIVFVITLLSLVCQGMTLSPASKLLKLSYEKDPDVQSFGLEMPEEMGMLRDHVVGEEELLNGATLRELSLPHGIRVVMVKRGNKFLVPHGSMPLQSGDHLLIVMGETDD